MSNREQDNQRYIVFWAAHKMRNHVDDSELVPVSLYVLKPKLLEE